MSSIPLVALSVKPPQPINVLGDAEGVASLKGAMQQQQLGQQEQQLNQQKLQEGETALNDQKATTAAMQGWDGKDLEELPSLVLKNGGSANAVFGIKKQILDQKKAVSQMSKDDAETLKNNLESQAKTNDYLAQQVDGLKTLVTDPKNPLTAQAAVAQFEDLKQKAVAAGHLDPKTAQGIQLDPTKPIPDQLQSIEDNLEGHAKVVQALRDHATAEHEKQMEIPAAERDFNAYFEDWKGAKGITEPNAKDRLQARKDYADMKRKMTAAGGTDELSPEAVQMGAQVFLKSGVLPTLGMGAAAATARVAMLNEAARQAKADGSIGDPATNKALYGAASATLKKLTEQQAAVETFANTADKNLALFEDRASKIVDLGSPWINKPLRSLAKGALGSEDQAAADMARIAATTEIARVINNPNLAGVLSDDARKELETAISPSATFKQIEGAAKVVRSEMGNRRGSIGQEIFQVQQNLKGIAQPGANAGGGGATAPKVGDTKKFPNGRIGVWDGHGWKAQ